MFGSTGTEWALFFKVKGIHKVFLVPLCSGFGIHVIE